jgi:hypothetical protein
MLFFIKKNIAFVGTMCHIFINGTAFTHRPSGKCDHGRTQANPAKRLDQAILDVIDNPQKTQQTTAIGTLF